VTWRAWPDAAQLRWPWCAICSRAGASRRQEDRDRPPTGPVTLDSGSPDQPGNRCGV